MPVSVVVVGAAGAVQPKEHSATNPGRSAGPAYLLRPNIAKPGCIYPEEFGDRGLRWRWVWSIRRPKSAAAPGSPQANGQLGHARLSRRGSVAPKGGCH